MIARNAAVTTWTYLMLAFCVGWWASSPTWVNAQDSENAVYSASTLTSSLDYYDASVVSGAAGTDICSMINRVYTFIIPSLQGAVIDARGISVGASNPCTTSPWAGLTASTATPATILLPAGTIVIEAQWVLPNATRIIGENRGTQIAEDFSSLPSDPFMILMGSSTLCPSGCQGIVIQDVALLSWSSASVAKMGGIDNENAGEFSYVDHVAVNGASGVGLDGTALKIGTGAANSGPYTNIVYSPGANCSGLTCSYSVCAQILAPTRGIHGMTCTADSNTTTTTPPAAAIELDSDNNSIEDIHFEGFYDGVVVGDSAAAGGNVIVNVNGGYGGDSGPIRNIVHICNGSAPPSACGSTTGLAKDLTVLGVGVGGNTSPLYHAYAIRDDVTGTIIDDSTASGISGEGTVGLYALGEGAQNGHSRFTTSPVTSGASSTNPSPNPSPVWATGSTTPSGSCPTGAIFTNTGGSLSTMLYVCVSSAWVAITIP